jgi:hypothetical protein
MAEVREQLLRCAIYTRKSTEEGLEQSFNSLQAQRESAEAYILSHKQEGWHTVPTIYNDGGFSITTAGSAGRVSSDPRSSSCSLTSRPAGWIAWWCTR